MIANRKPWLGCGMLALLGLFFAANADDPAYGAALVWLVIAVAIVGVVALFRWRGGRRDSRSSGTATVAACVRAPLMPVPGLKHAYLALPAHCRALLGL